MDTCGSAYLGPHGLKVVLMQPQIAPNTGNVARLCVASGAELHLVRPLGFILNDRNLRRSAMDYWPRLRLSVHDSQQEFLNQLNSQRAWFFSSKSRQPVWEARFTADDWLIFGSETAGIDPRLIEQHASRSLRIPQQQGERCLNLATSVGIGLYEALRQLNQLNALNRPDTRS